MYSMSEKDPSIPFVKNEVPEENYMDLNVDESMQIVKVEPQYEKEMSLFLMEQHLLINGNISKFPIMQKEILKNAQCMNSLQTSNNTICVATSNALTYSDNDTTNLFSRKRITRPNNEQKPLERNPKDSDHCELRKLTTTQHTRVVSNLRIEHSSVMYECKKCDYLTRSRPRLMRHVEICHGYILFKCQLCKFTSKLKNQLIQHLKIHDPTKIKVFLHSQSNDQTRLADTVKQCYSSPGCNCNDQTRLADNMKQCYSSTGFNCTHCDYVTKFKKRLIFHTKSCHDSE